MKSSIPSTDELRAARGGRLRRERPSGGHALLRDHVKDGKLRLILQALDQILAKPAGSFRLERRDDDLVDPFLVDLLHRRLERVGMGNPAVRLDARAPKLGERTPEPPLRVRVLTLGRIALRRDDQESRLPARRPLADRAQELLPEDGLVRDHEYVCRAAFFLDIDDDVL